VGVDYKSITQPILIVDDEKDIREILVSLLEPLGVRTVCADGAVEALALIEKERPVLILSDFNMPGMSGIQLYDEVSNKVFPKIPFMLVTGYADKAIAMESLNKGINAILEKPFNEKSLHSVVQNFLDRHLEAVAAELKDLEEILQLFVEESTDLLSDLDQLVLRLEETPLDVAVIDLIFRKVHSVKGGAGSIPGANLLAELGHEFESCLSLIKKSELQPNAGSVNVFLVASDLCQQLINLLKIKQTPDAQIETAVHASIAALKQAKSGKTSQVAANAVVTADTKASVKAMAPVSLAADESTQKEEEGVWVTSEKLDAFMKLSGELIVLKNYFQILCDDPDLRITSQKIDKKMNDFSYSLNKITDTLQDQIMSVRKITLERTFSKLPRIVRQVSQEIGKQVKLNMKGLELGVDKNIAKGLSACMTHMIRNSVDHGIEAADVRVARGKPVEGLVTLSAIESQGFIRIMVQDDGGGIARDKVLAKAIEKGLVDASRASSLGDSEVFDLIFLPGFSTAEKVSSISGRGVGMDVVKSAILALNGKVKIESALGVGSTFNIEIPVPKTVMVEQTVLVQSAGVMIAVPLVAIAQIDSGRDAIMTRVGKAETSQFNGLTIQIGNYSQLIMKTQNKNKNQNQNVSQNSHHKNDNENIQGANQLNKTIVVIQNKNRFVGLVVDCIYDQLEAVIRPFDNVVKGLPGFKGTTVLGDDSIAYVISPEEFICNSLSIEQQQVAAA